ncbi:MAG TPA: TylF/MycF/NovP-related O-methyltransferase, partial [Caulobacteraceae bacterium]
MSDQSPFHGPAAAGLSADPPQRYRDNYARYLALGGQTGLEADLRGFLAGQDNNGDLARFYVFSLAFDQIVKEGLGGDFAELGVYKGATAILLAAYARRRGATAHLLDTFEGFDAKDLTGFDAGIEAESFADTSLE